MSDRTPQEDLPLVSVPEKFINHWILEVIRLYDLSQVLYRSLRYAEDSDCNGDPTLVEHIKSSLDALFSEIEEVKNGHWQPRSWEVEDE